jgi:hypothetical protein
LAAISAAFGLATSTVNNFNSLLLQVDQTTVQAVVTGNRRVFREDLLRFSSSIDNKPLAIHTLRSYLSICMPMTISANINSTVTVFRQTGTAPGSGPMLPTVGAPFTPRDRFVERRPPPIDRAKTVLGAETIIDGYPANRLIYTPEVIDNILVGLCAPQSELTQITGITKALLNIWEQTDTQNAKLDGKIGSDRERRAIIALTPCPTGTLNAFERRTFATGEDVAFLVNLLNKVPLSGELPAAATLSDSRNRIALVRRSCFAGKLSKLPDSMNTQVTPDLMRELGLYARRRAAAETPAAPGGGQPVPTAIPAC